MNEINNKNNSNQQKIDHGFEKYKEEIRKSNAQTLTKIAEEKSGWSNLFYFFGSINLLIFAIGLLNLLGASHHDRAEYFYIIIG